MISEKAFSTRRGYTLIELLVAIGIILAVMGLVVAFYPSYSEREMHYRAVDVIKNALMRARQIAIRDKLSTGIAIIPPSPGETEIKLQFFQNGQPLYGSVGNFTCTPSTGGALLSPPSFADKVLTDDYLIEDLSSGPVHHRVTSNGDKNTGFVSLSTPLAGGGLPHKFRILRGPRPLESEPLIVLSRNVTVEVRDPLQNVVNTIPQIVFNTKGQIEPMGIGKYTIIIKLNETDGSGEVDRISLTVDAINGVTRGN